MRKDGASESPGNPTWTGAGVDPGGTPKPVEAPDGNTASKISRAVDWIHYPTPFLIRENMGSFLG